VKKKERRKKEKKALPRKEGEHYNLGFE